MADYFPEPQIFDPLAEVQVTGAGDSFVAVEIEHQLAPLAEYHAVAADVLASLNVKPPPDPPKPRERKIDRFAYFPCENVMQVAARAAVAGQLARRGWQCVVGDARLMSLNAYGDMPPGVILFNDAGVMAARAMYKAQSHGHFVVLAADKGPLTGCRWARGMADVALPAVLGDHMPQRLVTREVTGFRRNVSRLVGEVLGEMPSAEQRELLVELIDREYALMAAGELAAPVAPESDGVAKIVAEFHRLWVRRKFAMPWFNVMQAWQARKGETPRSAWPQIADAVVERDAGACVYLIGENVWAVRAKMAAVDSEAA